jgi:hypothetical protein
LLRVVFSQTLASSEELESMATKIYGLEVFKP